MYLPSEAGRESAAGRKGNSAAAFAKGEVGGGMVTTTGERKTGLGLGFWVLPHSTQKPSALGLPNM